MRWLFLIFSSCSLLGNIADLRGFEQTFINETLLGQGLVFQIMRDNLDAIKCVEGHKIYLKADRIVPSEKGMMLVGQDQSHIMLSKLYSDQWGCYIRSSMLCKTCGNEEIMEEFENCRALRTDYE